MKRPATRSAAVRDVTKTTIGTRKAITAPKATEGPSESHLGLLTIAHDYDAHLAWKFETIKHEHADIPVVTTMVQLDI